MTTSTSPRVLFATAELTPVARVGGLAEAAAGLVRALRQAGTSVHVMVPDYGGIELADETVLPLPTPAWTGPVTVRRGVHPIVGEIDLVSTPNMARPHPYLDSDGEGWGDNDHRFLSFSAAVAEMAAKTRPDVVHLNDWHTAAAAAWLHGNVPTMLTIHTLGYQGTCSSNWLQHLGPQAYRFAWWDATNPMAGAVQLVDRVITVSPNYAREIVTPEGGMGLHERLAALGDRLIGIRNGIDTSIWNPETDPHLASTYDVDDRDGREACRAALYEQTGWTDYGQTLIAIVSRLVDQKGIDFALSCARFLDTMPARMMVLGSGSIGLADGLRYWEKQLPDRVWFMDGYDEPLAHRLFAGSDLFLMPSRFEPCGLAQMQAMAYGSIPVVTNVGGLADTVIDADRDRGEGTGFVSESVDDASIVDALHRGHRAVRVGRRRNAIIRRGMSADWSWDKPAQEHIDLYRELAAGA
jgi:starch synthase